jgi:amino acid transporter
VGGAGGLRRRTKALLFFAFAFAVMADPVSSVAYAIEAALRSLHGHLGLLLPTMGMVIGIIALVTLNYWQLVRAFPEGGGSPEAAGRAFGEEWSFLPIGALVVDFALTIAISIAAAGSAIIAYVPALAPARIPIALGLTAVVAALTWFGHGGRMVFAIMTWLFIIAAIVVLALGWISPYATRGRAPITGSASPELVAVVLAFPVAMALATGTEAPATSIAQLGQLENRGRARFGRGTLALTIVIVGGLTMGLTALAVHLHVGIPRSDSTQIADLAHTAAGKGALFAFFQLASSVLLLAAASSSFQAGPGLLKALARTGPGREHGLLPPRFARTNRHHTPVAAVVVYAVISAAIILAASGQEQELVLVYAVSVFVSFLAGLLAMARFSRREGRRLLTATNVLGAIAVAFTLVVNLARGYPLIAIAGTIAVAAFLHWRWAKAGRPRGIEAVEREAEADEQVV